MTNSDAVISWRRLRRSARSRWDRWPNIWSLTTDSLEAQSEGSRATSLDQIIGVLRLAGTDSGHLSRVRRTARAGRCRERYEHLRSVGLLQP